MLSSLSIENTFSVFKRVISWLTLLEEEHMCLAAYPPGAKLQEHLDIY